MKASRSKGYFVNLKFLATLVLAATLAACSSTKLDTPPVSDAPVVPVTPSAPATTPTPPPAQSTVKSVVLHPLDDPKSALSKRSVFFEYDSYEIAPAGRALIEEHSKYLNAHASASVRLEGNADERGGREYNLALGQKRADAVRQAMKLLGVAEKQMESVSFGKEKPVALGHDEDSWAKNRRVDVNYQTR
jgi:peptidoglycan-associated lipoprotein